MENEIYYHRYTLKSAKALNSGSSRVQFEGVLIRIYGGVGCIHPWPELGDGILEDQLIELKAGRSTPLIRAALECARIDAEARGRGVSLFKGIDVPESHATIVGGIEQIDQAVQLGFNCLKIKVGKEVDREIELINETILKYPTLVLRLDFNCNLLGNQVERFVSELNDEAKTAIEFLEDPCGYKDNCWLGLRSLHGIRLAMDRGVGDCDGLYSYQVIKPAKDDTTKLMKRARAEARKAVVTSYMDHPIGQAYAAYCAAVANQQFPGLVSTCGLMTHGLFEPTEFSQQLGEVSPVWSYASGTGLGFDELLEKLEWKRLN